MSINFAPLRMDVAREEDNFRVWFRLYTQDAERLRARLDPGTEIVIRARVSSYLRSGGYLDRVEDHDPHVLVLMDDRFTVEPASLELALVYDADHSAVVNVNADLNVEEVRRPFMVALGLIRGVLDTGDNDMLSYVIEQLHEAEEILARQLGNPVWSRPE